MRTTRSRSILRNVALTLWFLVLAGLTLSFQDPSQMDPSVPPLSACLICGDRGTSDALLNLLFFVPLGVLLEDRGWRVLRVAIAGLVLSSSIEALQTVIPGRYSTLGDVVWNTIGAAVGAWLWSARTSWMPPSPARAGFLGNAAAVFAVGITVAFGWLMEPDWPVARYVGQWTPELRYMAPYGGAVERARLDSVPIPQGSFPMDHDARSLLRGDWTLEATAVKGPPPASLAPVLGIYRGREREIVMVGATGEDLVYRERSRARIFRLDQPDLRLPDGLAAIPVGRSMELAVRRRGPSRCLAVDGQESCPGFTPGRAWSLLMYPEDASEGARRWVDLLWMALLLAPVGFGSDGVRGVGARGAFVAAGVLVALAVTRLVISPWGEVVAGLLGLVGGWCLRRALPLPGGSVARAPSTG
jgi:hypothetical protein